MNNGLKNVFASKLTYMLTDKFSADHQLVISAVVSHQGWRSSFIVEVK